MMPVEYLAGVHYWCDVTLAVFTEWHHCRKIWTSYGPGLMNGKCHLMWKSVKTCTSEKEMYYKNII